MTAMCTCIHKKMHIYIYSVIGLWEHFELMKYQVHMYTRHPGSLIYARQPLHHSPFRTYTLGVQLCVGRL